MVVGLVGVAFAPLEFADVSFVRFVPVLLGVAEFFEEFEVGVGGEVDGGGGAFAVGFFGDALEVEFAFPVLGADGIRADGAIEEGELIVAREACFLSPERGEIAAGVMGLLGNIRTHSIAYFLSSLTLNNSLPLPFLCTVLCCNVLYCRNHNGQAQCP